MNRRLFTFWVSTALLVFFLPFSSNPVVQGLWLSHPLIIRTDAKNRVSDRLAPLAFSCNSVTEIPQIECNALVLFYNSTDGPNWTNHNDWLVTNAPCSWHGVICNNNRVTELLLHANSLSGSIPTPLDNLTNLRYLDLSDNRLSGSIPSQLGNLTNLQQLSLYYNNLSGSIPPQLGNLTNLQKLSLNFNNLSGSIPSELGNLTNLQQLDLYHNQLNGNIPSQLGNLTNLQQLSLSSNQLNGNIPSQLGNLTNLQQLHLYGNPLIGSIPPQLGNLTNLQQLSLNLNDLTGSIPSELGNLTNLQRLYLNHSELIGSIPSELGNLTNLTEFTLNDTHLSGPLPSNLTDLSKLTTFRFNNTSLCEPADDAFQAWLVRIPTLQRTNVKCTALLFDSGFRPNPDGFIFENTGVSIIPPLPNQIAGWYPNALQSVQPTKFFGNAVCAYTIGENCILRKDVTQWRKKIVDAATAGFCLGMALDSIFYKEGTPRPDRGNSTYDLSYNDAVPSIINSFAWQFVSEVNAQENDYRSKNVTETLQLIQNQLSQSRAVRISLRAPTKGSITGHAVVGYKLEPFGTSAYKLWVYDNTFPDVDHFAVFTPTLNTATYEWPDRTWRLVRAIPTNVYSGQYTWQPKARGVFNTLVEVNPPTMLVVPPNTTVIVNGVARQVQAIETGLGYATTGTVLVEPDELVNTTISMRASSSPTLTQDVTVFGSGKALNVSGLNQNDVIKLTDTLQSVVINTQQGNTLSISLAGDIIMGNSEATISTNSSGNASITFMLTDAANLTVKSDKSTLQSASIVMNVLQPISKTESMFIYSDLSLSSAAALTFTLDESINGVVDYLIERPSGNSNGTLKNQIQPKAFLPLIYR